MQPIRLSGRVVDFERGEVHVGATRRALTSREVDLLAYLASHAGEAVSRDELHTEVWGMAPTVKSRAVDFTLHRLRGKVEVDPSDPRHLLKVQGVGYKLVVDDEGGPLTPVATVLAAHVHRLAQRWSAHPEQTDRDLMALRRQVAAVASRVGGTVCRTHPPLLVFSDAGTALAAAWQLQEQRLPMTLALASGQVSWWVDGARVEVHAWAAERAELLARSFQPGSVVVDDASARVLAERSLEPPLVDLGTHVLADLPEPMRVFRAPASLRSPRHRPATRRTTNLWRYTDRFVGRDALRDQVVARLADAPGLVLWGPAGVGKTRLAREAAAEWHRQTNGEVWFCDLRPTTSLDEVLVAVAEAAGLPPDLHRATRALGARESVLLVLDNAEHVAVHVAQLVEAWALPHVRLLVTTRARMEGIVEVSVPPLSAAAATDLLLDRATAVRPGFADDHAASVTEIVEALGGLPLAIELAAARARWMNAPQMCASLAAHAGGQDRMEQALDWSWTQLDEEERAVLCAVSVFPSSFTLDDAATVTGVPEVAEHLAALRDWALLDELGEAEWPRLVLFDVVRRFATGRATDANTFESAAERHAAHVLERATHALSQLHGPNDSAAIRTLSQDLPDLLAVVERARVRADRDAGGAAIAALVPLLGRTGPLSLLKALVEPAVPDAEERAPEVGLALLRGAWMVWSQDGRRDAAIGALERMVALAEATGQDVHLWLARARLARLRDPVEEQEDTVREGVHRLHALGAHAAAGICAMSMANAFMLEQGDTDRAKQWYQRALALHRRAGARRAEGVVLMNLADLARFAADWDGAASEARAAAALLEDADDHRNRVSAMGIVGFSVAAAGDPAQGTKVLQGALALARRSAGEQDELSVLGNLSEVLLLAGDVEGAVTHAEDGAALARTIGMGWWADHCLACVACADWKRGERAPAIQALERAVRRMERTRPDGSWTATLAAWMATEGRVDEAAALLAALPTPPDKFIEAVHAWVRELQTTGASEGPAIDDDRSWPAIRLRHLL